MGGNNGRDAIEGMKKLLRAMIARDTMRQGRWLAVMEEICGHAGALPISNSFSQQREDQRNDHNFYVTSVDGSYPEGRWTGGISIHGKGAFTTFRNEPLGEEPVLGPARPDSSAQAEQIG